MCLRRVDGNNSADLLPAMIAYKIVQKVDPWRRISLESAATDFLLTKTLPLPSFCGTCYAAKHMPSDIVPIGCGWAAKDDDALPLYQRTVISTEGQIYPAGVHAYSDLDRTRLLHMNDFMADANGLTVVKVLLRGPLAAGYEEFCGYIIPVVVYKEMTILEEVEG